MTAPSPNSVGTAARTALEPRLPIELKVRAETLLGKPYQLRVEEDAMQIVPTGEGRPLEIPQHEAAQCLHISSWAAGRIVVRRDRQPKRAFVVREKVHLVGNFDVMIQIARLLAWADGLTGRAAVRAIRERLLDFALAPAVLMGVGQALITVLYGLVLLFSGEAPTWMPLAFGLPLVVLGTALVAMGIYRQRWGAMVAAVLAAIITLDALISLWVFAGRLTPLGYGLLGLRAVMFILWFVFYLSEFLLAGKALAFASVEKKTMFTARKSDACSLT